MRSTEQSSAGAVDDNRFRFEFIIWEVNHKTPNYMISVSIPPPDISPPMGGVT